MLLRTFTQLCRSTVSKGRRPTVQLRRGLHLHGIFINYVGQERPFFFSRTPARPHIHGKLSLPPPISWGEVVHHCNGLLLVQDRKLFSQSMLYVCNPATRRWAELPPRPGRGGAEHLVFDPADSLHYQVLFLPDAPPMPEAPAGTGIRRPRPPFRNYPRGEIESLPPGVRGKYEQEAQSLGSTEWPPSSYLVQVFSSRTGRWEDKAFAREEDTPVVTVSDVWSDPWGPYTAELSYDTPRCNAEYWQGAFYVHCRGGFVIRLSLVEHKYRVIKTPVLDDIFTLPPRMDFDDFFSQAGEHADKESRLRRFQWEQETRDKMKPTVHLGISKHGVYFTAVRWFQLRVWVLRGASATATPEWELKHQADTMDSFLQHYIRGARGEEADGSWILDPKGEEHVVEAICWDSSDDDEQVIHPDDADSQLQLRMDLLGYHPDKEIIFLGNHFDGFAYYIGSSRLEYLGRFSPAGCIHYLVARTHESNLLLTTVLSSGTAMPNLLSC